MSDVSGPKFGLLLLVLLIAISIDCPGNPVRKLALQFLSAFAASMGGSGGFLR